MKITDGKPFTVKSGNAIATVTTKGFTPEIVERFNQLLATELLKQFENQELRRA